MRPVTPAARRPCLTRHMSSGSTWTKENQLHQLALRQFGLFTKDQWRTCGLSLSQLSNRLRRGTVRVVFYKVYAIAGAPDTFEFRSMAGCLKAGPVAAASHETAAILWQLIPAPDQQTFSKIAAPLRFTHISCLRRLDDVEGYRFHRVHLPKAHIAMPSGVPVTDIHRTLLDACAELHPRRAGRLIDRALRMGLTSLPKLEERLKEESRSGRAGLQVMREHLATRDPAITRSKSQFEVDVYDFFLRWRFEAPIRNYLIPSGRGFPWEVDFCWPAKSLVVEADVYGTHGDFESFNKDRAKDLELEALGYRVIHVTDLMMRNEAEVARQLRIVLDSLA